DPVGADFARVLVEDRHPAPNARTDDHRIVTEGATNEGAHRFGERRHDAGDDRRIDVARLKPVHRDQLTDDDGVFVAGAPATRFDAELMNELRPVEETVDDVRVSYVDREEHWRTQTSTPRLTPRASLRE